MVSVYFYYACTVVLCVGIPLPPSSYHVLIPIYSTSFPINPSLYSFSYPNLSLEFSYFLPLLLYLSLIIFYIQYSLLSTSGFHHHFFKPNMITSIVRDGIFKLVRNPGIDSKESIPPAHVACAGIFKQSMGARNRVGIGLSYRPARTT